MKFADVLLTYGVDAVVFAVAFLITAIAISTLRGNMGWNKWR